MVQRALVIQVCGVCPPSTRFRTLSKSEMAEHVATYHGEEQQGEEVAFVNRSKDQMEFRPGLSQTPWGQDFKEGPRR